jgi:hypothetical protein
MTAVAIAAAFDPFVIPRLRKGRGREYFHRRMQVLAWAQNDYRSPRPITVVFDLARHQGRIVGVQSQQGLYLLCFRRLRDTVQSYPHVKRGPANESETRMRYVLARPDDQNHEIILTVMAFAIPADDQS